MKENKKTSFVPEMQSDEEKRNGLMSSILRQIQALYPCKSQGRMPVDGNTPVSGVVIHVITDDEVLTRLGGVSIADKMLINTIFQKSIIEDIYATGD